jgi:hypothetical protein
MKTILDTLLALPALVGIAAPVSASAVEPAMEWRPHDPSPSPHRESEIALRHDLEDIAKRADALAAKIERLESRRRQRR